MSALAELVERFRGQLEYAAVMADYTGTGRPVENSVVLDCFESVLKEAIANGELTLRAQGVLDLGASA